VKPKSSKWVDSRTKVGASHWDLSKSLRQAGKTSEADDEVQKALAALNAALKARREAGASPTDAEFIGNICDLSDVLLETGKAPEALALLDPVAKGQQGASGPAVARLMADMLRAHINTGQVELAQADMGALEKSGGGNAQLYKNLGDLLEKELQTLEQKRDSAKLAQTKANFQKFLAALVNVKSGQNYRTLEWAGENMLKLGGAKEAGEVFDRILDTAEKDKAFVTAAGTNEPLLRTRVHLVAALRDQGDFAGADEKLNELLKEFPRDLYPLVAQGELLEAKAAAGKGKWNQAFAHWQKLAQRLGASRTKSPEYYDAWYHAAYAMYKDGNAAKAKQILTGIKTITRNLSPEIKAKYDDLLKKIATTASTRK
jgi:hypothetical protein